MEPTRQVIAPTGFTWIEAEIESSSEGDFESFSGICVGIALGTLSWTLILLALYATIT
jgi:hypothetical protein